MESSPEHGPADPSLLRVSDADRHRTAEVLREAAAEGRLDLDELDERLEATYAAKVYRDLVPIVSDLPALPGAAPGWPTAPAPRPAGGIPQVATRHDLSVAILGGCDRKGAWEVGPTHQAYALMGGVQIDLREAVFTSRETVITCGAFWAGIDIVVNERTQVVMEGIGIMGAFEQGRDKVEARLDADSPIVRVKGIAVMAGVTVVRKGPPKARRKLRGGGRPELP
ncbi:DUF1707 domain-containing protein [Nocardioides marmotae]|uniref:DUF1707 SHOCT-like domain-containing protein n=1 Tax=Nocardioides marmotae TaxID=2663857 RepID=UPI0012B5A03E|nr:DUF1707 domain-containing protein [Nocardioides marmotae]MBC9734927.1 DUF1707 domain-containing protein [Nocardioides marmotae]MTB86026.1 DUF1707 domain-containing protein [Nocardioides marmotae]